MARAARAGVGRPLHPFLVHFPIALYPTSLLFDGLSHAAGNGSPYVKGAFALLVVGLAFSVPAAVAGYADFRQIDSSAHTWRVASLHLTVMVLATGLFLGD